MRVSSEVDGIVKDVMIEIGQEVKAGEVIVQIDPRELQFAWTGRKVRFGRLKPRSVSRERRTDPADDQVASVRTAAANRDDAKAQLASPGTERKRA